MFIFMTRMVQPKHRYNAQFYNVWVIKKYILRQQKNRLWFFFTTEKEWLMIAHYFTGIRIYFIH